MDEGTYSYVALVWSEVQLRKPFTTQSTEDKVQELFVKTVEMADSNSMSFL